MRGAFVVELTLLVLGRRTEKEGNDRLGIAEGVAGERGWLDAMRDNVQAIGGSEHLKARSTGRRRRRRCH